MKLSDLLTSFKNDYQFSKSSQIKLISDFISPRRQAAGQAEKLIAKHLCKVLLFESDDSTLYTSSYVVFNYLFTPTEDEKKMLQADVIFSHSDKVDVILCFE